MLVVMSAGALSVVIRSAASIWHVELGTVLNNQAIAQLVTSAIDNLSKGRIFTVCAQRRQCHSWRGPDITIRVGELLATCSMLDHSTWGRIYGCQNECAIGSLRND
jgi:hypothetical protein